MLIVGAILIGFAVVILAGLVAGSMLRLSHWPLRSPVAERLAIALAGCLALGLGCIELAGASPPGSLERAMWLVTLLGFALMWWWFRLNAAGEPEGDRGRLS